jgi:hypothetical protein
MINEKKFMYTKIQELNKFFRNATFKYQFKEISDTHFIQVIPKTVFNSADFIVKDIEITEEFESLGLDTSICFISEDSLTELENPEIFTVISHFSDITRDEVTSLDFKELESEEICAEQNDLLVA